MRHAVSAALVALVITATAAQSPSSQLSSYQGKWQAAFQGKPFFVLNLSMDGATLRGTISHTRDIHVNDKGELDKVTEDMSEETITETKIANGALRITAKNENEDSNSYEMRLSGNDEGTIRVLMIDAPPDVPKVQPWKITRASSK